MQYQFENFYDLIEKQSKRRERKTALFVRDEKISYGDSFEGVASSAVIGIYDDKNGEIPIAYIELDDGITDIDEAKLKKYLRENLANYKVPRQLHFIDELPKNATGKVLKRELKAQLKK